MNHTMTTNLDRRVADGEIAGIAEGAVA